MTTATIVKTEDVMENKLFDAVDRVATELAYMAQVDNVPWELQDTTIKAIQYMKAAGVKEMHVDARRGDRKTGYAYLVATFDMAELTPDSKKDDEPNETKYSGRMVARALRKMFRDWTHVQIRVDLRKIFDWRTAEYTRHEMWMLDVRELMDARKMDPRDNPLHNRELMQEVTKLYGPYPYITNFDQCLVDNKTVFATVLLNF